MYRSGKYVIVLLGITIFMAFSQLEQDKSWFGFAVKAGLPLYSFKERAEFGGAFSIMSERMLLYNLSFSSEASFFFFKVKNTTGDGSTNDNGNNIEFGVLQAGPKYYWDRYFMGIDAGYLFGRDLQNEWGIFPNAGFKMRKFDVTAEYKLFQDINYFSIRTGIFLFNF